MMHLSEEDLILLYYGETGADPDAKAHLAECAECRSAAGGLARTLGVCNEWNAPEKTAEFGRDVWLRLVPELDGQPEPKPGLRWLMGLRTARIWVAASALALVLVAVFLAGRFSRTTETPMMAGLSDQARDRILAIAVADHLDRVQMLMTEISNTRESGPGSASTISFKDERDRAEDLLQEGRLMRQTLAGKGETATTSFLDEVERFLTEAAHTPDSVDATELRDLRGRIESGSLLFKVRIVESNLRNEEQRL